MDLASLETSRLRLHPTKLVANRLNTNRPRNAGNKVCPELLHKMLTGARRFNKDRIWAISESHLDYLFLHVGVRQASPPYFKQIIIFADLKPHGADSEVTPLRGRARDVKAQDNLCLQRTAGRRLIVKLEPVAPYEKSSANSAEYDTHAITRVGSWPSVHATKATEAIIGLSSPVTN